MVIWMGSALSCAGCQAGVTPIYVGDLGVGVGVFAFERSQFGGGDVTRSSVAGVGVGLIQGSAFLGLTRAARTVCRLEDRSYLYEFPPDLDGWRGFVAVGACAETVAPSRLIAVELEAAEHAQPQRSPGH